MSTSSSLPPAMTGSTAGTTASTGVGHLLADLPARADANAPERFDALVTRPGVRIERIVSTGQASPPGFWYDQPQHEWVAVLTGAAGLAFEDAPDQVVTLRSGDCLEIAAHRRHRVAWTAAGEVTVWLAVFYD